MIPIYQEKNITPSVSTQSQTTQGLMQTATAAQRLTSRLSGLVGMGIKMQEPVLKEEAMRKALKDVEEGKVDTESVSNFARGVYRQVATNAMLAGIEVQGDKEAKALMAAQEANNAYDVGQFEKEWTTFSGKTLQGITDPIVRNDLQVKLSQKGQQYGSAILALQAKQMKNLQTKNLEDKLALDTKEFFTSIGVVKPDVYTQKRAAVISTLDDMVLANRISPATRELKIKELDDQAYVEANLKAFKLDSHPVKYIEDFRSNTRLSVEDTEKAIALMHNEMASRQKAADLLDQQEDQAAEALANQTKTSIRNRYIDETLTMRDLGEAYKIGAISMAEFEDYSEKISTPGLMESDEDTYHYYLTNMNMVELNEILDDPRLSKADKRDLRTKYKSEQRRYYAKAEDYIDLLFSIVKGEITRPRQVSKILPDHAELKTMLYDQLEALPIDKAYPNEFMKVARDLGDLYNAGKIPNTVKATMMQEKEELPKDPDVVDVPLRFDVGGTKETNSTDINGSEGYARWMN